MSRIRLAPTASITPTPDGALLRSDLGTFRLDGPDARLFVTAIAPLLDGTRDRSAIAEALGDYAPASVLAFLGMLGGYRLIEEVSDTTDRWRSQREFFRKWTDRPDDLQGLLSGARVLLVGLEPWGVAAAAELADAGVGALHLLDDAHVTQDDLLAAWPWTAADIGRPRAAALAVQLAARAPWCQVTSGRLALTDTGDLLLDDASWSLALMATSADDLRLLRAVARFAQGSGVASLSGYLDGLYAVAGPAVVPGATACWNCGRLRLLANADQPQAAYELHALLLRERPAPRAHPYLAPSATLLGHLLAIEALRMLSGYAAPGLAGRILFQNLVTLEATAHPVVPLPWCEICGGARGQASSNPASGAPLSAARTLEELYSTLAGWVDARTGVIRRLAVEPPNPAGPALPLVASATGGLFSGGGPREPVGGSGKGLTAVEALVGAAGEAIERYSAARVPPGALRRANAADLTGDWLDPSRLSLYAGEQYLWPGFPYARFDPERPIDWTQGYWLDDGAPVWLPAQAVYMHYPAAPAEQFGQFHSNGLAAGASSEEATLRALFELVERDAFMLAWLARRPGRRLMIDQGLDAGAREVLAQLAGCGAAVELYLLDAVAGITAIACLAFGDGRRWPGVTVALAAHASPRQAARKAILEQAQTGPYLRQLMWSGAHIPARPQDVRTLFDHALYYVPPARAAICDFLRGLHSPLRLADLAEPAEISLRACAAGLSRAGLRVAIKDVTAHDVALSPFRVVRAIGPDFQPIDFGFNLRRLGNPRLAALLSGLPNPHPHPIA